MKKITPLLFAFLVILVTSCSNSPESRIKNVILMIGDGMGLAQITAGRIHVSGPDGQIAMDKMPVTGFVRTHSLDRLVTDSAAAATAMATGTKTNNGTIAITARKRLFVDGKSQSNRLGLS